MSQRLTFGDLEMTQVVTDPPYYENAYVVHHVSSGAQVVIDPGSAAARIRQAAAVEGGSIGAIWLTHGHPDHIGAVHTLEQELTVKTLAHREEKPVIDAAPQFAAALMGEAFTGPSSVSYFDGEPELTLGGHPVRVIHTPGHTPGGVCYDFGDFVLTGDTLFNQGVGRTDFPGGDGPTLRRSISRLLELLPDQAQLFSGHGPGWSVAEARQWWQQVGQSWF